STELLGLCLLAFILSILWKKNLSCSCNKARVPGISATTTLNDSTDKRQYMADCFSQKSASERISSLDASNNV
uniref:Uncharacterized protein n=1 Tax=Panagrolaimus sp. PS1159 TaxID=55785 RepID=A0AC35GPI4_9BILA